MDGSVPARTLAAWAGVVGLLVAVHLAASGGTLTIKPAVLAIVATTPETTISRWWAHFVAGFFHTTWLHITFNIALFALAFPLAGRSHGPLAALGAAYATSLIGVFLLHVGLVRPLAGAGFAYANEAMTIPLVGFSVIAYATAGLATANLASPLAALAFAAVVVAFELAAGAGRLTGPFIFVYHLFGYAAGFALAATGLIRRLPA